MVVDTGGGGAGREREERGETAGRLTATRGRGRKVKPGVTCAVGDPRVVRQGRGGGGGQPPNGALPHPPPMTILRGTGDRKTSMRGSEAVQPRRLRAADAACPAAAAGRTSPPPWTVQYVVNNDTRLDSGRGERATQRGDT